MDWKSVHVQVMDFEGSAVSGVVEFGVVTLYGGAVCHVSTDICSAQGAVSARERAVHGIDGAAVGGRQPFSERYAQFIGLRRKGIFCAHNRHAEAGFLRAVWPVPSPVPAWPDGGQVNSWGPWIDTLGIYRNLYPGLGDYGLAALIERFGMQQAWLEAGQQWCPESRRKPHCALFDALGSALLLLRLETVETLAGRIRLQWLLQLSGEVSSQEQLFQ
jgi:DNA polymerase-3 subunit epsilon